MDGTPCIIDNGLCSILWDLSPDGIADIAGSGYSHSVDCAAFNIGTVGNGSVHLELDCDNYNAVILCNAVSSDNNVINSAKLGFGNRNKDEWSFDDLNQFDGKQGFKMDWVKKYKIVWLSLGLFGMIIVCSIYQIWYCCKRKKYIPVTITDGFEKYAY